jgi:hypothetical protein
VESYLFGDTYALAKAKVPVGTSPRLARSDVEDFETQDPDPEWQQRYRDENARTQPKHPWWRTECHPKRYLEHLTRHGVFYEETFHGRAALEELRWKHVLRVPHETCIARSLFEDLAEWFDIDNPAGEGSCHENLFPGRRVDRSTLLLRNI